MTDQSRRSFLKTGALFGAATAAAAPRAPAPLAVPRLRLLLRLRVPALVVARHVARVLVLALAALHLPSLTHSITHKKTPRQKKHKNGCVCLC